MTVEWTILGEGGSNGGNGYLKPVYKQLFYWSRSQSNVVGISEKGAVRQFDKPYESIKMIFSVFFLAPVTLQYTPDSHRLRLPDALASRMHVTDLKSYCFVSFTIMNKISNGIDFSKRKKNLVFFHWAVVKASTYSTSTGELQFSFPQEFLGSNCFLRVFSQLFMLAHVCWWCCVQACYYTGNYHSVTSGLLPHSTKQLLQRWRTAWKSHHLPLLGRNPKYVLRPMQAACVGPAHAALPPLPFRQMQRHCPGPRTSAMPAGLTTTPAVPGGGREGRKAFLGGGGHAGRHVGPGTGLEMGCSHYATSKFPSPGHAGPIQAVLHLKSLFGLPG